MGAILHLGSAADVLHTEVLARSVHMVYADPPFGNDQTWIGAAGKFSDRWRANAQSESGWAALRAHNAAGAHLRDLCAGTGASARPYLGVMAGILLGVQRVLHPVGTLWLHFDDTMGAQLRILCDAIFGPANALGTLIWKRATSHGNAKRSFSRVHDTIAVYGRTRAARWRLWRLASPLAWGDPALGRSGVTGVLSDQLNARAAERVGYPTQKPLSLLHQFVQAASLPGETVLDPTCGSGTTLVAALGLGRNAIGIDVSPDAIAATRSRTPAPPTGNRSHAPVVRLRQLNLFGEAALALPLAGCVLPVREG